MKTSILCIITCLLLFRPAQAQTYYKKISYNGGHFSQPIPRGYKVFITGAVDANENFVRLSITDGVNPSRTYDWKRGNDSQTEFEVFMSDPLQEADTYTFNLARSTNTITTAKSARSFTSDGDSKLEDDENHGSRWGIVAGAGYAFLGKSDNRDGDLFGHVAAKFYVFKRVDKTLKFLKDDTNNPLTSPVYKNGYERFSIIVGGAVTKLAFKGKELSNPVYGVKPMAGIGFDFLPELSLDAGVILFDYQRGNASLFSELEQKVGLGIFTTLSLDIDVFTRLRTAFSNKPYDKTLK